MTTALAPGLADPVFDAQRVFRAVMNALARPGIAQPLEVTLTPPAALPPELAAVALTLADHEAPLWLDDALAAPPEVAAYLRFHTGAAIVANLAQADFALIGDPTHLPDFSRFAQGSLEYPDRSTTLVIYARSMTDGPPVRLAGPGIAGEGVLSVTPLPPRFVERWSANRALFPRGVDLLFAGAGAVVGLPRSTRIVREGSACT